MAVESALTRLIEELPGLISDIKRTEISADLQREMIAQERDYQFELHKYDQALEDRKFWQQKSEIAEIEIFKTGTTAKSLNAMEQTAGLDTVLANINPASSYQGLALNEDNKADYYKKKADFINDTLSELELIGSFMTGSGGYEAGDPDAYDIKDFTIKHYDLYRLKNVKDIQNIGLFENTEQCITLIEWPELIKEKPTNRIDLFLEYSENMIERSLIIKTSGRLKIHEF